MRAFITLYNSKELTRLARSNVKGKGRYVGWEIRVVNEGVTLLAKYKDKDGWEGNVTVAI